MNTRSTKACHKIREEFGGAPASDYLRIYEFSNSTRNEGRTFLFWEKHSVESQMLRGRWSAFIEALLSDGVIPEDDASKICPQRGS